MDDFEPETHEPLATGENAESVTISQDFTGTKALSPPTKKAPLGKFEYKIDNSQAKAFSLMLEKLGKQLKLTGKDALQKEQLKKRSQNNTNRAKLLPEIKRSNASGESFIMVPQIGVVESPLYSAGGTKTVVAVASRAWLRNLDQMRAIGMDMDTIRRFKRNSMLRIERDALWSTRRGTYIEAEFQGKLPQYMNEADRLADRETRGYWQGVEDVEFFCMAYPDKAKADVRFKKNLRKLYDSIRKKSAEGAVANPFLPQKLMPGEKLPPGQQCKPMMIDFTVKVPDADGGGGYESVQIPNILRNWTKKGTKKDVYLDDSGEIVAAYECEPHDLHSTHWIPLEEGAREAVESAFSLSKYMYTDADVFRSGLFRLMASTDPETQEISASMGGVLSADADGVPYIAVTGSDGAGYILSRELVKLSMNEYMANETETQNMDISLRDFLWHNQMIHVMDNATTTFGSYSIFDGHMGETIMYPLIHVLLNIEPLNGVDPSYTYANILDKSGKRPKRMFADAPFMWFQQSLLATYGGSPDGRPVKDCFLNFKKNFWADISSEKNSVAGKDQLDPNFIPDHYAKLIRHIFEFGGNTKCYAGSLSGDMSVAGAGIPVHEPRTDLKHQAAFGASASFDDFKNANKEMLNQQFHYLLEKGSK